MASKLKFISAEEKTTLHSAYRATVRIHLKYYEYPRGNDARGVQIARVCVGIIEDWFEIKAALCVDPVSIIIIIVCLQS